MKLKYYLRGMGVGVIITAVIFMIAFAFHKPALSDEEIELQARKLGMVYESEVEPVEKVFRDEEPIGGGEPADAEVVENENTDKADAEAEGSDATAEASEGESSNTEVSAPSDNSTETASGNFGKNVNITVSSGSSSYAVAKNLASKGLVDNAEKFDKFLDSKGYASRIQPGSFDIPEGASYDEIGKILTTK